MSNIRTIFPLNQTKSFTHEEAIELVPLLQSISSKTKKRLGTLNSQLSCIHHDNEKAQAIQEEISNELQSWSDKVRRLGVIPISLCKARIPGEDGHFLWEYPENRLFMY